MKTPFDLSVYFIVDPSLCGGRDIAEVVALAVKGGATMIQLRNKTADADEIAAQGRALLNVLRPGPVPLLINDYPDVAADIGADGVHIGQGDVAPEEARAILGPDAIVGLTAFTEGHFSALDPEIIDYVGTGPVYPTLTDKGKSVMGINNLANFVQLSPVPVVGIGGITSETADDVFQTGAVGVAMIRAISGAEHPDIAAHDFVQIARKYKLQSAA